MDDLEVGTVPPELVDRSLPGGAAEDRRAVEETVGVSNMGASGCRPPVPPAKV